jgi:type II secretory pathway predicted ATPase ExeA
MGYQQFYRFSRDPFAAPTNAEQIFLAEAHRDAMSALALEVQKCRPFLAVSGDGEVGKSTVLNAALASLPRQPHRPLRVTRMDHTRFAHLGARQIIGQIIGEQGRDPTDGDLERLSRALLEGRDGAEQHLLVIDDVRSVDPSALQFLHLLSSVEPRDLPVVQVILAGRHEFWRTLANDEWCPTRSQAVPHSMVEPLGEDEVRQYIDYRLRLAGSSIAQVMTDAALDSVRRHGHALPGRINRVLDHAFALGAAQRRARITPEVVDEAVALPQFANQYSPAGFTAHQTPTHTVGAPASRRRGAERPNRRVGPALITRRRSGWVGAAAAAIVLGLAFTMWAPHPGVNGDLMAASIAPRDTARAPIGAAMAADKAPEMAKETVAQEQASAAPADLASAENVTAPASRDPVIQTAALLPSPNSSGVVISPAITAEPPTQTIDNANVVPSDPGSMPTGRPPSPDSHPEVASLSGSPAAEGRIEEQNMRRAPRSPQLEAATQPDAMVTSSVAVAPIAAPLPTDMLTILLERGAAMLEGGDISAARKLYARAAEGGSGLAAAEVGKTYDPSYLADKHVVGMQPDWEMASIWYRRAIAQGDAEAMRLMQRLDSIAER